MIATPSAPRALIVFPATSYRPDAFVAAAAALGIELVLATDLPSVSQHFQLETVSVSFDGHTDPSLVPEVDGVLAVDETSALVAAAIASAGRSRRAYHCVAGVEAASDKGVMRAVLADQGVANPAVRARVRRGDPMPKVPFPCVVKPPQLSGSQGVIRADDDHALARAVSRARHILHRHRRAFGAPDAFFELLVEDFVAGAEVAVEGLMQNGVLLPIVVFDKPDPMLGPFFEETIYVTPSGQTRAVQRALHATTEQAAVALGLSDGPVHAELRVGEGGVQLIEIAARSIGGLCSRALQRVIGSLEELLLCHAVGRPLPPIVPGDVASGVMMIPVPRSGVLRQVRGVASARATAHVDAVTVSTRVGDAVVGAPDGDSYLGFIFAHGDTASETTQTLRSAHSALDFDIAPSLPLWA